MIAARTVGGPVDPGMTEGMERDLTKGIEDIGRAVDIEGLRRTKETGEHFFLAMVHSQLLHVEQALLLVQLQSVKTDYELGFCCKHPTFLRGLHSWAVEEPV